MLTETLTEWPNGIQFSMAPWGYTVIVNRVADTPMGSVKYSCRFERCTHDFVFPADSSIEAAAQAMRKHVDEKH